MHFGQTRDCAQKHIFHARQRGRRDRDRISIAAQTGRHPDDVYIGNRRWSLRLSTIRNSASMRALSSMKLAEQFAIPMPSLM